jgi:non-histone protein 10
MNEVEEANDASRQRIVRMERCIQKMRLERAFLLEQLSRRTSTNVEDSDGSPSPPPTVCPVLSCRTTLIVQYANKTKPKEKPLRTKRGHRKPSFLTDLPDGRSGATFIQQGPVTISPSSDAFSHSHLESAMPPTMHPPVAKPAAAKRHLSANGRAHPNSKTFSPKRLKNAFDTYCNDVREGLTSSNREGIANGTFDVEQSLARGWQRLNDEERASYQAKYEDLKKAGEVEKANEKEKGKSKEKGTEASRAAPDFGVERKHIEEADEDVEMGEDGDDASQPGEDVGGFTAVNRG